MQIETDVRCPHCAAGVMIALDPGGGAVQDYVEDCQICCRPWRVVVRFDDHGGATTTVQPLD